MALVIRLLTITLKQLDLVHPNSVIFTFYLFGTFWQNFSKIDSLCYDCFSFSKETFKKIEGIKVILYIETREMQRRLQLWTEKDMLGQKIDFFRILMYSWDKYQILMTCSLLEKDNFIHISKNRQTNILKFFLHVC